MNDTLTNREIINICIKNDISYLVNRLNELGDIDIKKQNSIFLLVFIYGSLDFIIYVLNLYPNVNINDSTDIDYFINYFITNDINQSKLPILKYLSDMVENMAEHTHEIIYRDALYYNQIDIVKYLTYEHKQYDHIKNIEFNILCRFKHTDIDIIVYILNNYNNIDIQKVYMKLLIEIIL